MVRKNIILHNIFREVKRNQVIRKVTLVSGKLRCDCRDDNFTGIPCRHLLVVATKDPKVEFSSLKINSRWKISYYTEKDDIKDPEELSLKSEEIQNNDEISFEVKYLIYFIINKYKDQESSL